MFKINLNDSMLYFGLYVQLRRGSVAGYTTDESWAYGPKEGVEAFESITFFIRFIYAINFEHLLMAQVATMNQAQLQILDMLSFIKTPEALRDLNKVISDYFVQMADAELDRMWNEGTLNEERIESFRHLHERTPYNKPKL